MNPYKPLQSKYQLIVEADNETADLTPNPDDEAGFAALSSEEKIRTDIEAAWVNYYTALAALDTLLTGESAEDKDRHIIIPLRKEVVDHINRDELFEPAMDYAERRAAETLPGMIINDNAVALMKSWGVGGWDDEDDEGDADDEGGDFGDHEYEG